MVSKAMIASLEAWLARAEEVLAEQRGQNFHTVLEGRLGLAQSQSDDVARCPFSHS